MKVICTEAIAVRVHLGRALELQHAGVVVGFACCCLGGADEVPQGFGHILHCINEDHLGTTRTRVHSFIHLVCSGECKGGFHSVFTDKKNINW